MMTVTSEVKKSQLEEDFQERESVDTPGEQEEKQYM